MSNWTHPICDPCWAEIAPGREPFRFLENSRELEVCCFCGDETESGIYVRHDPSRALHCTGHDDG